MTILCCSFDSTSKIPGASFGADSAYKFLCKHQTDAKLIKLNSKNSGIYCSHLYSVIEEINPRLIIGGEHLVTFPAIENLLKRTNLKKIIVFDAHHDCYDYPLLTHFSLFHYLKKEFDIEILFIGVRFELKKSSFPINQISTKDCKNLDFCYEKINNFIDNDPFYLSFDIDVIDPNEFISVSDPVKDGPSLTAINSLLDYILAKTPVASDIVEYNPLTSNFYNNDKLIFDELLKKFYEYERR